MQQTLREAQHAQHEHVLPVQNAPPSHVQSAFDPGEHLADPTVKTQDQIETASLGSSSCFASAFYLYYTALPLDLRQPEQLFAQARRPLAPLWQQRPPVAPLHPTLQRVPQWLYQTHPRSTPLDPPAPTPRHRNSSRHRPSPPTLSDQQRRWRTHRRTPLVVLQQLQPVRVDFCPVQGLQPVTHGCLRERGRLFLFPPFLLFRSPLCAPLQTAPTEDLLFQPPCRKYRVLSCARAAVADHRLRSWL